jgi:hypothetical protein
MASEHDIDKVQALADRIEPLLLGEERHIVVATLGALLGEAIFSSATDQSHAALMSFADTIAKQLKRQLEERLQEEAPT